MRSRAARSAMSGVGVSRRANKTAGGEQRKCPAGKNVKKKKRNMLAPMHPEERAREAKRRDLHQAGAREDGSAGGEPKSWPRKSGEI